MSYQNKDLQRQTTRERVRRYRERLLEKALQIQALPSSLSPNISPSEKPPIASIPERLEELTQILRHPIEVPVTAGHKIAAVTEMNKMEHIYETRPELNIDNRQVNIYVKDSETKELLSKIADRTGKLTAGEKE